MRTDQCHIFLLEARARELLMGGEARAEAKASVCTLKGDTSYENAISHYLQTRS